jgi:hypothetical protein
MRQEARGSDEEHAGKGRGDRGEFDRHGNTFELNGSDHRPLGLGGGESDQAKAFGGSRRDDGVIPLAGKGGETKYFAPAPKSGGAIGASLGTQAPKQQPMPEQQHVPPHDASAAKGSQGFNSTEKPRTAWLNAGAVSEILPRALASEEIISIFCWFPWSAVCASW